MQGQRVYFKNDNQWEHDWQQGDYGKNKDGIWFCRPPIVGFGVGCLSNHNVIEHENGTITVSPSILITGHKDGHPVTWHGYLEQGIWRMC